MSKVDKWAKRKHETNFAKEEAIFVLLYRRPFTHQAVRFDALAGLVGRPQTVRTGKLADMTLALSHGIRQPVKKALRFLRSIAERSCRSSAGGRSGTRRSAQAGQAERSNQQPH